MKKHAITLQERELMRDHRRSICIVTGTRAEYGLLKPIMKAVQQHPRLALTVCAAGMHLDNDFGHTIDEIRKDGFPVAAAVRMSPAEDTGKAMAAAVGTGISSFTSAFSSLRPDIVVVLGDRIEALAAAVAAAYMTIPVAHIHGGDVTRGGLDESARHAISRFAHLHFAATRKSADRLRKMGEEAWRIHTVGAPGLDTILHAPLMAEKDVLAKHSLRKPYLLVVQHPVTTQVAEAAAQMRATLHAVQRCRLPAIVVHPNSDAGGRAMIKEITGTAAQDKSIKAYPSLPHQEYLSLLQHAACLVGNSSSGIIEAASFRCPVVNIGSRQERRERAGTVIDAGHDAAAIGRAIKKAMSSSFRKKIRNVKNPYGDGTAGKAIASILAKVGIDHKLIQKQLDMRVNI